MNGILKNAMAVAARLEEEGWEAALVGGAVRDLLCGIPVSDADIAVNAPLQGLVPLFPEGKLIGPAGKQVLLLPLEEGRCEASSYAGASLADDLLVRDFTVNALALRQNGEIVGSRRARADVSARILRFNGTPADRLAEDPLRALRLARLAAALPGFSADPSAASACRELRPPLDGCAPERVGREVRLGLEGRPHVFLKVLKKCGLLGEVFPGLLTREYEFARLCAVEEELAGEGASLAVRAAALFSSMRVMASGEDEPQRASAALTEWRWPGRLAAEVAELVRHRRLLLETRDSDAIAALFGDRGAPFMDNLFTLARRLCVNESHRRRWGENRAVYVSMAVRALRDEMLPTGEEIMEKFSLEPGPEVGKLADALKMGRIKEGFESREEAFHFLEKLIKRFTD
ncbi:MAG: CCA tRNA nucleotidyltransferase [Synergistaceae bacterium]|nr:CCA tRNA nucleotidyltransferase [Synergistaceae bacterium]